MYPMAKPIPEGFHSLTAHLIVPDIAKAMDWYAKALGAEETVRITAPGGGFIMHAEMRFGDSPVMIAQENPEWGGKSPSTLGGTPVVLHLYVKDVDAVFKQAVAAGAQEKMAPADQFWGDRYAKVADPFGHEWSIATHIADPTPEEMNKAMAEMFAKKD
jgi:uncharacterized glyoxalase superfamily protein PhnB